MKPRSDGEKFKIRGVKIQSLRDPLICSLLSAHDPGKLRCCLGACTGSRFSSRLGLSAIVTHSPKAHCSQHHAACCMYSSSVQPPSSDPTKIFRSHGVAARPTRPAASANCRAENPHASGHGTHQVAPGREPQKVSFPKHGLIEPFLYSPC